jgi:hypothetical protein
MTLYEIALLIGVLVISFMLTFIFNKCFVFEVGAQPPCIDKSSIDKSSIDKSSIDNKISESEQKTHNLLIVLSDRIESIERKFKQKPKKKVGRPKKKVINEQRKIDNS